MPDNHAERMRMVRDDAKADATRLDSTPFTPRGIGETFGQVLAMIAAIADTVAVLAEEQQKP